MNNVHFLTGKDDWETPQELYDKLDEEFGFTLDPCATKENAKCAKYYTLQEDGLAQNWAGEIVFCNPPYSRRGKNKPGQEDWIKKCYDEAQKGAKVIALLPARTDTRAFHSYIYHKAEIRFIRGRIKFGGAKNSAPFPSMLAIWG